MVAYAYNHSTGRQAGDSLEFQVWGQPHLFNETLSNKQNKDNKCLAFIKQTQKIPITFIWILN